MAGTPAPTLICRRSARCPASCMSTARETARQLSAAGRRHHFRAGFRRAQRRGKRRRRLAARGGLARARKPQRSGCLQRQDVEAGPVALVHLGHRVPDGFHGNWVGANVGRKRKQSPACHSPMCTSGICILMPLDASWPWRGREGEIRPRSGDKPAAIADRLNDGPGARRANQETPARPRP